MNRTRARSSSARHSASLVEIAIALLATLLLMVLMAPGASAQTAQVRWPKATRALERGAIVGADDFVLVDTVIAWHVRSVAPDTTRAIAGWITRRPIAAGEFMRPPSVAPAPVVIMGSTVKVLWQDGPVALTLTGTATNNAALGAPVGVRIDRNRRLDGVAVGSNTVRLR